MHSVLTSREYEIFNYLLDNLSTKEIASLLHITEKTVRNHISNVIIKLDVKSRSQAIVKLLLMNEIKLKRWLISSFCLWKILHPNSQSLIKYIDLLDGLC